MHNDIAVLQPPYNMLNRSAEQDLLPYCVKNDISFIAYGLLGGKYTKDFKLDTGDWRISDPLFQGELFERTLVKNKTKNAKMLLYQHFRIFLLRTF